MLGYFTIFFHFSFPSIEFHRNATWGRGRRWRNNIVLKILSTSLLNATITVSLHFSSLQECFSFPWEWSCWQKDYEDIKACLSSAKSVVGGFPCWGSEIFCVILKLLATLVAHSELRCVHLRMNKVMRESFLNSLQYNSLDFCWCFAVWNCIHLLEAKKREKIHIADVICALIQKSRRRRSEILIKKSEFYAKLK